MRLGYLGPEGSYSHEAGKLYNKSVNFIAMDSFFEIFKAIDEDSIDKGILPIENSIEGAVTPVMDGLLKSKSGKIIGEIVLTVNHKLISPGNDLKDIRFVYSHPQALEQCRDFLQSQLPKASLISCDSTSLACNIIKDKGKAYGAIANQESALLYKLNILKDNIQDNPFNQTRFIIIAKTSKTIFKNPKSSIAFSFGEDRPGSLYKILKEFSDGKINLTRIESRPDKSRLGKYVFYIDFLGSPLDQKTKEILENIKTMTSFLKILGTYDLFPTDLSNC